MKRGSLTSFHRFRAVNRCAQAHNIYQRTVTAPSPAPPLRILLTPPCPSKSLKSLDDQLYRHDPDVVASPQIVRHDLYLTEPLR